MVYSQFETVLKEFEPFFGCRLQPNANQSCLIKMKDGVTIQMELDHSNLVIGCRVSTHLSGRYRHQLIQQALKSNGTSSLSAGIFGFSHRSSSLILFIKIDPATLSADRIPSLLTPFLVRAKEWTEAISRGEIPTLHTAFSEKIPAGLFGLGRGVR